MAMKFIFDPEFVIIDKLKAGVIIIIKIAEGFQQSGRIF